MDDSPAVLAGALSVDKNTAMFEIRDGASKTILLAEIAGRPQLWQAGRNTGKLVAVNTTGFGGWGDGTSLPYLFGSSTDGTTTPGPCAINCSNAYGLYSFHRGGVNTVFVDGSVHFVSETANLHSSVIALITRNGGEVVSDY
jgi:prepilin-type processing-associated H-X9-DG protein